jgi:dTDP-4-dehydrorhamnose 3,5-epimerase
VTRAVGVEIIDFEVRPAAIDGVLVVTMKQVTDERGTIRELFRRSAFEAAGIDLAAFQQINVTGSHRGAVRGLHAEAMTKLVTVSVGRAFGVYLDLRRGSSTFGVVETVDLSPGTQVLVPSGVANGFQALADHTQYVYCFDREWQPGMAGQACTPLDPDLAIDWPLPIDVDDPAQISAKDRGAPRFAELPAANPER